MYQRSYKYILTEFSTEKLGVIEQAWCVGVVFTLTHKRGLLTRLGKRHRFAETIFRTAGGRFLATAIVPALETQEGNNFSTTNLKVRMSRPTCDSNHVHLCHVK